MNTEPYYDNEIDMPVELSEDPYAERTVYDVEKIKFKNLQNNEEIEDFDIYD